MKRFKIEKRQGLEYLLVVIILLVMMLLVRGFETTEYKYQRYETATTHYVEAKVLEVVDQELTLTGAGGEYFTGQQRLKIEISEGEMTGKTIELTNYVTVTHNIVVQEGSRIIVCADIPENCEPYYSVYNYSRGTGIYGIVIIFLLVVILIGKKKGFYSCLGLLFTMVMVMCYLLPNLYQSERADAAAMITVVLSALVSCFCIGGVSKKTFLYMLNTVLGTFSAGIVFFLFTKILHITGCCMDDAESLVLISQTTGLQMNQVLFAGIMITSLGAVMDIAVSISAAMHEIAELNEQLSVKRLFQVGMNIGKDMIGTMTNTLILAFAGGSISTLIVFISYGVQYHQLLSSDYLTMEIAKGVAGSMGVVLTVPISALISAFCYGKHRK